MIIAKFFMHRWQNIRLMAKRKRKYHRESRMSKAEVIVIMFSFIHQGIAAWSISISKRYASTCAISFLRWYPTTDGSARAEPKLVWIMPKHRANESRVKLYTECSRYSTKLIATEEDDSQPIRGTWKGSSHPFGFIHQEGAARKMYWHKFRGQHSP